MSSRMGIWEKGKNVHKDRKLEEDSEIKEPSNEELIAHDNFLRCETCGGNVLQISKDGSCWVCGLEE